MTLAGPVVARPIRRPHLSLRALDGTPSALATRPQPKCSLNFSPYLFIIE